MAGFVLVAFRQSEYNALKQVNLEHLTHQFCARQLFCEHYALGINTIDITICLFTLKRTSCLVIQNAHGKTLWLKPIFMFSGNFLPI